MTMTPSAAVPGCLASAPHRRRSTATFFRLALLVACMAGGAREADAETYAGVGVANFEGGGLFDSRSHGLDLYAGWTVRGPLSLHAGVIDQSGDYGFVTPSLPRVDYGWRAWHLGPRWNVPLGERARLEFGIAAAHVAKDRDAVEALFGNDQQVIGVRTIGKYRQSHWGGLATIGLAADLGERHQLRFEYRRLHAGLDDRCESRDDGYLECGLASYTSVDGLGLSWSYRFD
jgi:hypothetical protein